MEKENLYSPEALVDLIMEGDLSISRIAKETNIPLPTLKNYVYGKTDTASMPYRMIKDLTDFFRKGQPLELMLEDNDCVMLSGLDNAVIQFPHIKNSRIHTFKVLSELNYRYNIRKDDKDTKFEPFLVVLTKEMLEFCECGMFACSLLQTAIENCDSFNVRFVTTEYILMASHLSYLRYLWFERSNIKMFVKCNDNNGIKKLSELDKATGIKQHIISMIDSNNSLVEYCYYIIFGNKMATQNISTVLSRLEPGLLYDHIFDFEKDYEFINDDINSLMFDAVTSKYDFIAAVTFADYDNLFNNKHTYFTNSQFSGEVHSDSFSSLDCADEVLKNVIINDYHAGFRGLVTDIKKPIRPNHFNIKKFIEDKNIDKSSDIFVNVTFRLKDKDIVTREYIHSIEYITLDGEKCVYKF